MNASKTIKPKTKKPHAVCSASSSLEFQEDETFQLGKKVTVDQVNDHSKAPQKISKAIVVWLTLGLRNLFCVPKGELFPN